MPDQEELSQQKAKKQNKGFFGSMSATQKALLILFALAVFFLIWNFVFGGIKNFYQFVFFAITFIALIGMFFVVLTFISWYLAPDLFSPKKDYFNRCVNLACDLKPDNVFNLYFRGDKDKRRVSGGKIVGLLGIPYFIGEPKLYEEDIIEKQFDGTEKVIAKKGELQFEWSKNLKRLVPIFGKIEYGQDGDTFFIYERGWFFFKKRHYLRCNRKLHGDLHGDVDIYDINPVPFGSLFEYPFKQMQSEPARIMLQNQLEVILATHEHQYDLISQGVDSAVYFNPYFRLLHKSQAEMSGQS